MTAKGTVLTKSLSNSPAAQNINRSLPSNHTSSTLDGLSFFDIRSITVRVKIYHRDRLLDCRRDGESYVDHRGELHAKVSKRECIGDQRDDSGTVHEVLAYRGARAVFVSGGLQGARDGDGRLVGCVVSWQA